MKNIFRTVIASAMTLALTACGGGGSGGGGGYSGGGGGSGGGSGGGYTPPTYYTHEQLAQEFVNRVNSTVSGYDLEIVKATTLQSDYIVVYDWDYQTYDAYYIGDYTVGDDLGNYLWDWQDYFYYDLWYDSAYNEYVDPYSGIRFEKKAATGKDLAKLKGIEQQIAIDKTASHLQDRYGLSESKSLDVARIAYHVKNAPAGSVTNADIDRYAKEITGSTVTEFQNDIKSGNFASLNDRIDQAGEVTGMGPEATQKLIKDMFLK